MAHVLFLITQTCSMHFSYMLSSPLQVSAEIYARFGSKIYPAHSKQELLLGRCGKPPALEVEQYNRGLNTRHFIFGLP